MADLAGHFGKIVVAVDMMVSCSDKAFDALHFHSTCRGRLFLQHLLVGLCLKQPDS